MSEAMASAQTKQEPAPSAGPAVKQESQPYAEQFAEFLKWKEQQEKAKKEDSGDKNPGSPKKAKMDDSELEIFKLQLAELSLQWDEMEPELREKLRLSEQARADFLAVHRRTDLTAYDPKRGGFTEEAAAERRHDFEATSTDTVMEGLDPQLQETMLRYHANNVLPNLTKLFEQCGIFYGQVMQETSMQQMTNERIAAQVQSLERSRANRTVLLHELPPFTTKRALDNNINHFLWGANLEESDVCALHNHLLTSSSVVVRVEFLSEIKAQQFLTYMRNSKKYWKTPDNSDTRLRAEQDVPTDDRLSMQPFHALLDILNELEDETDFQVWRQTLQIWSSRKATAQRMLAQVAYVLDARYSRRYCCLLLLCADHYDAILNRWHGAFSQRMRSTMNLIQALRRAVIDRTTTTRPTYDKAFDVSNVAFHHHSFPYPIFPMRMGPDLAKLLESHPLLPFQGAGGLLSLTQQAFQDYGANSDDFGKGAAKNKSSKGGKGKGSNKGSQSKGSKGSKDHEPRTPRGKSSGKGSWKERDHDYRTNWWNQDPDDGDDWNWGPKWGPRGNQSWGSNQTSNQTQNKGNKGSYKDKGKGQDSGKKGSKQKPSVVHQVQICLACTCALGYNLSCSDCAQLPIPPGFTKKGHMPVKAYYCPSNTEAGHICGQLLGTASNCPFCAEARRYWSSAQVQEGWTTLPLFRKCELLQLDRILYEMEVIDPSLSSTCNFIESMQTLCKDHTVENFSPQQWAAYWLSYLTKAQTKTLLPLPRPTKLAWNFPNWDLSTEDIVNCYGPLNEPILQQTFYIVGWFASFLHDLWKNSGVYLSKQYELEKWAATFDEAHSPLLPWPELIASSFALAYEHAQHYCSSPAPTLKWSKDVFDWMLQPDFAKVTTDLFQVLAEEAAGLLDGDPQVLSLVKGEHPYTNAGAASTGGFGSLYFDAVYWQLSVIYGVAKDPKTTQLQAPNDGLVHLYEYILPLLQLSKDEVRYIKTRGHVNKGNIMESLTLILAESGSHWLVWRCAWAIFLQQHRHTKLPWVVQVSVY